MAHAFSVLRRHSCRRAVVRLALDGKTSSTSSSRKGPVPHLASARSREVGAISPPGKLAAGRAFVWMDRDLDLAPALPETARDREHHFFAALKLGHYDLYVHCVMANHVHMLIEPKVGPGFS